MIRRHFLPSIYIAWTRIMHLCVGIARSCYVPVLVSILLSHLLLSWPILPFSHTYGLLDVTALKRCDVNSLNAIPRPCLSLLVCLLSSHLIYTLCVSPPASSLLPSSALLSHVCVVCTLMSPPSLSHAHSPMSRTSSAMLPSVLLVLGGLMSTSQALWPLWSRSHDEIMESAAHCFRWNSTDISNTLLTRIVLGWTSL